MTLATPAARTSSALFRTPRGQTVVMTAREGTSDGAILETLLGADEYHLRDLPELKGWAIDLGAHVGGISAALLADNPELRVIAVEPLHENVEILERNLEGYGDRAEIVRAMAGSRPIAYSFGVTDLPQDYAIDNRYVAGPARWAGAELVEAPTVSLRQLLDERGIDELALLKTDCEGGEWEFLSDAGVNERIRLIRGEFHDDPTMGQAMVDLLAETHLVTIRTPDRIVGLFDAVRLDLLEPVE